MSARPSLFSELPRRNVLRAGVRYAGAVWAFGHVPKGTFVFHCHTLHHEDQDDGRRSRGVAP